MTNNKLTVKTEVATYGLVLSFYKNEKYLGNKIIQSIDELDSAVSAMTDKIEALEKLKIVVDARL